jgi:hypothetical protein
MKMDNSGSPEVSFFARPWAFIHLQAKDRVSTRMSHFGKRDKSTGKELVTLVHVDTAEGGLDVSHGGDAVEGPDRRRFRHTPRHGERRDFLIIGVRRRESLSRFGLFRGQLLFEQRKKRAIVKERKKSKERSGGWSGWVR